MFTFSGCLCMRQHLLQQFLLLVLPFLRLLMFIMEPVWWLDGLYHNDRSTTLIPSSLFFFHCLIDSEIISHGKTDLAESTHYTRFLILIHEVHHYGSSLFLYSHWIFSFLKSTHVRIILLQCEKIKVDLRLV